MMSFSCRKEEFSGERPDLRLEQTLTEYQNQLSTAKNGWKGHLFPSRGGGYGFLFKFDDKNRVNMMADINAETGAKIKESSFRLKAAIGPSLYFDTYSYIHILADPNPNFSQGAPGWGRFSDFEFQFLRSTQDTIVLKGNLLGSELYLVRATAEEEEAYGKGNLNKLAVATEAFVNKNHFPFITTNNSIVSVKINLLQKTVDFAYVKDDKLESKSVGFAFSGLNELILSETVEVENLKIEKLLLDQITSKITAIDGKEIIMVHNSTDPIIPLTYVLGVQYQSMRVNLVNLNKGTGIDFKNRKDAFVTEGLKALAPGTTFPELRIVFLTSQQLIMAQIVVKQGNNQFLANYVFSYVKDGNFYKLNFEGPQNQNGQYLNNAFIPIRDGLLNGRIEFDYQLGEEVLSIFGKSDKVSSFKFVGALN